MNKRIFVSLIAFLLYVVTYAAIGDWRLHTSYYAANYCQIVKDRIFVYLGATFLLILFLCRHKLNKKNKK